MLIERRDLPILIPIMLMVLGFGAVAWHMAGRFTTVIAGLPIQGWIAAALGCLTAFFVTVIFVVAKEG